MFGTLSVHIEFRVELWRERCEDEGSSWQGRREEQPEREGRKEGERGSVPPPSPPLDRI